MPGEEIKKSNQFSLFFDKGINFLLCHFLDYKSLGDTASGTETPIYLFLGALLPSSLLVVNYYYNQPELINKQTFDK